MEEKYFQESIDLARKSVLERGKINPYVGAVIVNNRGVKQSTAYRGELKPGEHGEFTLLGRKLKNDSVDGSTLYVTLEPCTTRGLGKTPCAERIIKRKIKKVFIGMLDPNEKIQGNGVRLLRENGIDVQMFPAKYAKQVEDLNREFTRYQYKQNNLRILSHDNGDIVDHQESLFGTVKKIPGNTNLVCCVSFNNKTYYPQSKRIMAKKSWISKSYFGNAGSGTNKEYFFIVGFAKKATEEKFKGYNKKYKETGKWIPIPLDLEKDFEHYVQIRVKRL
jgi:pyrimidine deaminase RibD-like protein